MNHEAAAWKARYDSVVHLVEAKHVEAAEQIVRSAVMIAASTVQPFGEVVRHLTDTAIKFREA